MRMFYSFAIFFSVLTLILGAIYALCYFALGRPIFVMESFSEWFLVSIAMNLIASLLILKYYAIKKYDFALVAAVIATFASLSFSLVVYSMMMGAQLAPYYIPVYIFSIGSAILYGASLLGNPAGKRPLLRVAGFVMLFLSGFLLAVVIAFTQSALSNPEVERIHQWTGLVGLVIPVLFILNFMNEQKTRKTEQTDFVVRQPLKGIMTAVGIAGMVALLFVGPKFIGQSVGAIAWRKQAPERARRLAEPFEARTFTGAKGETLLYRFMKPAGYDSTKQYPIVIALHHGGTHGNDNMSQIDGSPAAQVLTAEPNRQKYPAFLFVPQAPEGIVWGGVTNVPAIDDLVFEALAAFEEEFSIDDRRRYVIGSSGGGYGSWHFICSRPEMFAAAVPICGGVDPQLAPKIVDVPVWVFHGENDTAVPVRFSRDMVAAIRDAGGDPKYTEFPGAEHNIWELVRVTPGLWDWMFAQEKAPGVAGL
jgi:predicted esterase